MSTKNLGNQELENVGKINTYTPGSAMEHPASDFATDEQGAKADTALQNSDIGTSVQGYSENLSKISNMSGGLVLKTITGIDGKSTSEVNLFTPSGASFVTMGINVRITDISGFITVGSASVGQNGTVNDIVPITPLTALSAASLAMPINVVAPAAVTADGGTIKFKLTTAYVATSVTLAVDLIGYFI